MPQPIRAYADEQGQQWLVLDNGHEIPLPGSNGSSETPPSTPGVTDHGDLTGLGDDDHPQYVKDIGDRMTGLLVIDRAAPNDDTLRLEQDLYPTLRFVKKQGTLNAKQWNVYISGDAAETAGALTFLAENDDFSDQATFRMYRAGQLRLGADPINVLDAATKQYVDAGVQGAAGTMTYYTGWQQMVAGVDTYLSKNGGVVTIQGIIRKSGNLAMTAGSAYRFGTIPAGFRPVWDGPMVWAIHQLSGAGSLAGFTAAAYAEPNGNISLIPQTAGTITTGQWLMINGCWYV